MIVKKMKSVDVKIILWIEELCFSDPWSEKMLIEELESEHTVAFSAEIEGRIIGFAIFKLVLGEAELLQIAVSPDKQGRGYAKKILSYAFEEFEEVQTIFLEVRSTNFRAIKLYESLGFVEISRRRSYYENPEDDAIIYQKNFN